MVDRRVHRPAQLVRRVGSEGRGVLQGVRDGVQVARAAEAGGEDPVGHGAEECGAHALADLAAEEDGRGRRAAFGPAHGGLDADDQGSWKSPSAPPSSSMSRAGCQGAPG